MSYILIKFYANVHLYFIPVYIDPVCMFHVSTKTNLSASLYVTPTFLFLQDEREEALNELKAAEQKHKQLKVDHTAAEPLLTTMESDTPYAYEIHSS